MLNTDPWLGYIKPGRIFGNLYFVGTTPSSVHLVDVGDGLMLIDSGYFNNLYLVIQNIWELGFDPKDIKYIIHSHGHFDHVNATSALVAMTGARTYISEADLGLINGDADKSFSIAVRPFEPDVLLHDGDVLTLGNTTVRCVSTPGHTDGTTSFFFNITDGNKNYIAGMHGGVGLNTLSSEFITKNGFSFDCRQKYFDSLTKLEHEQVDIVLGNHVGQNDTAGKLQRVANGEKDAFVDPLEWKRFLAKYRAKLEKLIESEKTDS